ncbi:RTA1 like protein-domain-containing protein [Xylariales sp. PMI_506]|nr:RTA1 like protein-domain-containing protein [Xylariales sp. PMI_506]
MGELKPYKGGYYLWSYVPSLGAAVLFDVLFLVITAAHCARLYKTKCWFCLPFVIGGFMESAGYTARALASNATDQLLPYILQSVLTLLPPVLFAATIYMVLGRVIRAAHGEEYSFIRLTRLTKTFVWGDVVSFLVQGNGASLMAIGSNLASMGQWIVIGGLALQVAMFSFFIALAVTFQYRYQRYSVKAAVFTWTAWKETLYMIYGVSILIMIRNVYRIIEFLLGSDGYPMTHEWILYVFDPIPMFVVMVIFFLWYPSRLEVILADEHQELSDL